ncbi:hypothetical protein E2C01_041051 [Portunus trituberculatus]|uniref:Uncharacterized protein n=1 Tax=Portunus trituberculatus TaxID=210409 RepID=A0A5B7FPW9_PORTR|nr:hypothetical protein [Portunus trituberculatus]
MQLFNVGPKFIVRDEETLHHDLKPEGCKRSVTQKTLNIIRRLLEANPRIYSKELKDRNPALLAILLELFNVGPKFIVRHEETLHHDLKPEGRNRSVTQRTLNIIRRSLEANSHIHSKEIKARNPALLAIQGTAQLLGIIMRK